MRRGIRRITYPCRVYAKELNLSGRDNFRLQGVANDENSLYETISRTRFLFRDPYKDLDLYVSLTDDRENFLDVKPSDVLKEFGGDREKEIAKLVRRCQSCIYMRCCRNFGRPGCNEKMTVSRIARERKNRKV